MQERSPGIAPVGVSYRTFGHSCLAMGKTTTRSFQSSPGAAREVPTPSPTRDAPSSLGSLSRDLHILQQMVLQEKEPITSSSLPGSKKDGLVTHEGKRRFLLLKDFLLQNHIIQWKKCQG